MEDIDRTNPALPPPYDPYERPVPPAPKAQLVPYFGLLKLTWQYAGGARLHLVLFHLLYIPAIGFSLIQPWAFGQALNALQHGGPNFVDNVIYWLAIFTGAIIVFWTFHGPGRVLERLTAFKVYENFLNNSYRKLSEMPLVWHQRHHSGEIINRLQTAANALRGFAEEQFVQIQMVMRIVGTLAIITWMNAAVGAFSAISLAISFAILIQFDRRMSRMLHEGNELNHRVSAQFFDFVSNMSTLLILRLGQLSQTSLAKSIRRTYPNFRSTVRINEAKYFAFEVIVSLLQSTLIIGYIVFEIKSPRGVAIGTLVALVRYQQDLGALLGTMAGSYNNLIGRSAGAHAVAGLLDDHALLAPPATNLPPLGDWQKIDLAHLSYHHAPRAIDGMTSAAHAAKKGGIADVSLTIRRGERIALIGTSGGGKSSLLGVLRGIYPAESGTLNIDGTDLPMEALGTLTTLIPQDPEIFENTVRYNMTLGLPASDADIFMATKLAAFDLVLATLPQGLETTIVEKGNSLSGGQKQRLALARGLFAAQNSSIILLDEPTSSLDLSTEREVFDNIFAAFPNKTIVATLHRLHLLPLFDRIVFMDSGYVTADGPAADLLASPGPVRDLYLRYQNSQN